MKAIGEFLLSALQESFGRDLGQSIALISCFFLLLAVFVPVYLLIRALAYRAKAAERAPTSSEDVIQAIIPSAEGIEVAQSRDEFIQTLESVKRGGLEIYRYLTYAIVAALIAGGIYYTSIATTGNGLILVAILLFAGAAIAFGQMERFQQLMTWKPSLDITKTLTIGEPTVVKMESNALRTAQDLLSAGKDMDSVCREINPEYAQWGSIQQQLFRKTMESVLKSQRSTW
jgi:hypothetical protein